LSRGSRLTALIVGVLLLSSPAVPAAASTPQTQPDTAPCAAAMISSHEGFEAHADGDTIASQKAAFRVGATLADSDLWVTKDGYIIQMHSNDVHDSTNGHGLVTEMTLGQILSLRTRHYHNPIPTLDDSLVLKQAHKPGRYLQLETKFSFADHANLQMLVDHITEAGMTDHVVIYSAFASQLTYLKQIDPELTVWFKAGQVPPVSEVEGFDGVMLNASEMTTQNVAAFHAAGLTVIRQRVNETKAGWQGFLATGADGLMTDREKTVIHWCRQLGE
jgi:glycerophosphoryl diester phosphodiesterase